jgi:hypothetical protein
MLIAGKMIFFFFKLSGINFEHALLMNLHHRHAALENSDHGFIRNLGQS